MLTLTSSVPGPRVPPRRSPRNGAWLTGLVLLLLLSVSGTGRATLVLNDAPPALRLEPHVAWLCDPTGHLTLDEARTARFTDGGGRALMLGYRPGACWLRFRLENRSPDALSLVLQLGYPVLDRVELHAPGSLVAPLHGGDGLPFSSRPLLTRLPTFPLSLAADQEQDYFLRIESTSSMNVPLLVAGRDAFLEYVELTEWLNGAGFGITIGLILYHLFLWLGTREQVFRSYVLYITAGCAYLLCLNGIGYRLWPDSPDWNSHAQPFFLFNTLALAALFARDFLGPAQLPRRHERALLAAALVSGLTAWLQFGLPLAWVYPLQSLLSLPVVVVILLAAVPQIGRRGAGIRIFLFSWVLVIASTLLLALQTLGLFRGLPIVLTLKGMEITFILQQLLLALALADRLNQLKRERGEQEQAALRAAAESAAKTEFLARMSHEIRTPLNALLGITQLLHDTRLDKTQQRYVDTLFTSGHALMHVINDVLDYSKIVAGKVELEQRDFNLLDLLDECVQIFSVHAREKSLALVCEQARDLPVWLRGDSARLRQVLLNLLGNAVKFTESGTVSLRASVAERDAGRVRLCFEVEDTGIGIAADKIPLLFHSFSQADVSNAREYGGTGLGLAISRQIVELMQGRISVSSTPGQGSLFRFTVMLGEATLPAPLPGLADMAVARFEGVRALVVEDNSINQMVIRGFLDRLGVDCTLTASGTEALELLRQGHPPRFDIIFMDCEMPLMDGFETTRRLRVWERKHGIEPHRVVALTAHALPEYRAQCLAAGMDDYLAKPLLLPALAAKLREILH